MDVDGPEAPGGDVGILGVPGSQIENERVFSIAGLVVNIRRQRLHAETLDMLVNIYKNFPGDPTTALTQEAINSLGLEHLDDVDLSRIVEDESAATDIHYSDLVDAGYIDDADADVDATDDVIVL